MKMRPDESPPDGSGHASPSTGSLPLKILDGSGSRHGLQELGLAYKAYGPSVAKLEHLFMVNEVHLMLEERQPGGRWRSERELRAGVSYVKGDAPAHMVDAEWTTNEGRAAIEVELSAKKPAELQRILQELTATYAQVRYYVTDITRSGVLVAQQRLDPIRAKSILVLTHPQWEEDEDEEAERIRLARHGKTWKRQR